MTDPLPEVTLLRDRRGERPANAVGAGDFWYEPEIWTTSGLSPAAKVLYAGLCAFLGHGGINRHDLRNTLKASSDEEIVATFEELKRCGLLVTLPGGYSVHPVKGFSVNAGSEAP